VRAGPEQKGRGEKGNIKIVLEVTFWGDLPPRWSLWLPTMAYQGQGHRRCGGWWCSPPTSSSDTCQADSGVAVWASEYWERGIDGCIIGIEEYLNLVLDDADKIHRKTRKQPGWIMLKDFWVWGQPGLQSDLQDSQGYTEKPCLGKKKKKVF
jgi:small nuclear ribonucleoprotein E